jgi:hypothetical protein
VHPAAVLYLQHVFYARILRRWRIAVSDMPAIFSGIRTTQALLYHVQVQQIYLAKIDGSQRHTRDTFVAVSFSAAFPVDLFYIAAGQGDQQVRTLVIV